MRPGDSFWSIAAAERVSWYNLAADNGLQLYTVLDTGQVLRLPAAGESTHAPLPLEPSAAGSTGGPGSTAGTSASAASPSASSTSASSTYGGSSFEQCVISRESGGNPAASNGAGYWGLFQFSQGTWAAYGGNPADYGQASAGEQERVFNNAVAQGGASNWAPYDGC